MMTESTTEQARFEKDGIDDDSVGDNRHVAWYARGDGELINPLDTPVYVGEVYEMVSVMLKHAPLDFHSQTDVCVVELLNHRAWPGFIAKVIEIYEVSHLYDQTHPCSC